MRILATALALLALPLVTTAQTVTPTMPDNKPLVSGGNLIFTFQTSGITFGKGASIELHPQGSGTYNKFGCLYDNATYPPADYVCTVNAAGLSGAYQNTTVEYQTFVSDYNNPNSGTSNFSGFVYSYPTNGSSLPVELTAFTATTSGTSARLSWTTLRV